MILAVRKGHTTLVRPLPNSGKADTSMSDRTGLTALDIAVKKDHGAIINPLSHCSTPSREFPLREEKNEAIDSSSTAQQIGRWFQ